MSVRIGNKTVGDGHPVYCIAEVGINHNGSVDLARQLIATSAAAGFDAVKFQKRTVDVVYTAEELDRPRENPFGRTNGDLKRGLEFGFRAYNAVDSISSEHGIAWFASPWDEQSVDFLETYNPPAYKVASASLTDTGLLRRLNDTGRPVILSTGMSTLEECDQAVGYLGTRNLVVLHCTSTYPSKPEELNLRCIPMLKERYKVPVGYSGHEVGLQTTYAAVALGACMVERHVTMDRSMWGSDQAASVEPQGMFRMIRDIRTIEKALGDGRKRVYDSEKPIKQKLRRVDAWAHSRA